MTSLITVNDGTSDTTSPALVLGYETSQESQNIIHDIIGGGIAVTLVRPRPRSGTLRLFYLTEADANAARLLHTRESSFTLSDTDLPTITMTYVLDGSISPALDDEGRKRWVVEIGYQEIEVGT